MRLRDWSFQLSSDWNGTVRLSSSCAAEVPDAELEKNVAWHSWDHAGREFFLDQCQLTACSDRTSYTGPTRFINKLVFPDDTYQD